MEKRHLDLKDRKEMEEMYRKGSRVEEIAEKLGFNQSTIYNELRRGETGDMDENGRMGYSAVLGQQQVLLNYRSRRRGVRVKK